MISKDTFVGFAVAYGSVAVSVQPRHFSSRWLGAGQLTPPPEYD